MCRPTRQVARRESEASAEAVQPEPANVGKALEHQRVDAIVNVARNLEASPARAQLSYELVVITSREQLATLTPS